MGQNYRGMFFPQQESFFPDTLGLYQSGHPARALNHLHLRLLNNDDDKEALLKEASFLQPMETITDTLMGTNVGNRLWGTHPQPTHLQHKWCP